VDGSRGESPVGRIRRRSVMDPSLPPSLSWLSYPPSFLAPLPYNNIHRPRFRGFFQGQVQVHVQVICTTDKYLYNCTAERSRSRFRSKDRHSSQCDVGVGW
jgi:hypothetical protein